MFANGNACSTAHTSFPSFYRMMGCGHGGCFAGRSERINLILSVCCGKLVLIGPPPRVQQVLGFLQVGAIPTWRFRGASTKALRPTLALG